MQHVEIFVDTSTQMSRLVDTESISYEFIIGSEDKPYLSEVGCDASTYLTELGYHAEGMELKNETLHI